VFDCYYLATASPQTTLSVTQTVMMDGTDSLAVTCSLIIKRFAVAHGTLAPLSVFTCALAMVAKQILFQRRLSMCLCALACVRAKVKYLPIRPPDDSLEGQYFTAEL